VVELRSVSFSDYPVYEKVRSIVTVPREDVCIVIVLTYVIIFAP
jgi:hypothetical protein